MNQINTAENRNKIERTIDIDMPINLAKPLDDIIAYYQPIVSLDNQLTAGYEALARKVVDKEAIAPVKWLPQLLAEKNGSERLTRRMLDLVLEKMTQIPDDKYMSVNFEIEDINNATLHSIIQKYQQQECSHRLIVEITERGDLSTSSPWAADRLKEYNLLIALDDFGSGASRLLSLIDFKPNVIKLDKIVTDRIAEKEIQSILKLLSDWCGSKGTKLLAEGIEKESQILHCINAGVDYGQGYYFGKPAAL